MKRVAEVQALITEISETSFLSRVFGDTGTPSINFDKLVVAGHSMGGATALRVGEADDRISAVLTHDPWNSLLGADMDNFDSLLGKTLQITDSVQFRETFKTNDLKEKLMSKIRLKN